MVKYTALASLLALASSVDAWGAPGYRGFNLRWQETFSGSGGSSANSGNWNIISGYLNVNDEWETYSSSTRNVQLSGGNTLRIVPWRDGSAQRGWTSGRLESKYVFTPDAGRITRVEAALKFGTNSQDAKQGIWPAWWMLGDSIRHGKAWPSCGELDIMENINGRMVGYGTAHCQQYPGGICNEPNGLGAAVNMNNNDFHTWRLEFDRRNNDWTQQTITWFLDGRQFQQLSGSRINDYNTWVSLCQSPMYFILNVAVGGGWPGAPNGATQDGFGSMMEVGYVAHYST
ncbi:endo-1,3(4)-beta-glucanase [Moelleriella libera RCEF 2490]|uniref:Endo-1,3(4)-beta-glucanase n=1 Tax=Moelleriella libera RCEF 2490 TaxID=1081109 RepID=A0A167Y9V4_9HYPO|nr:endo-1,3(4)-beta-glucanase [Moelleriella libera RCEF 2490]